MSVVQSWCGDVPSLKPVPKILFFLVKSTKMGIFQLFPVVALSTPELFQ
jgi:hypothetical protein